MSAEEVLFEAEAGMEKAAEFMMHEFNAIRTGKASPALVENIEPNTAGTVIRIPLPPLTEERRRDITKVVRGDAEGARVAVRNVRRDVLQDVKEALKEKMISQDEEKKAQEEIQKLTDKQVEAIDKHVTTKEAELMTI
ncbi:MAG: ribosome recycling factor [Verrucomicrobia bacterium]|nr:ribosome recycling factor [Verrucomicrobiota bacterium]